MNLDLGSFAFGSSLLSGGGTPSWGTSLGQSSPDYRFSYPGAETIVIGMVYCSVPLASVSLPMGKGGRIFVASARPECQIASVFHKVFINGKKVDYPFIMVLVKESSESHNGRRSIKYSDKNAYEDGGIRYTNESFVSKARQTLGLEDDACWFVHQMEVREQDELHLFAAVVDKENTIEYENSSIRKEAWKALISENGASNERLRQINNGDHPLQQISYGAPGTGKSHELSEKTKGMSVVRTTFHPDSDYSTFVGAYKPTMKESSIIKDGVTIKEEKIAYSFVPQAFLKAYVEAWNTEDEVFLIIEEINRGNCAQIFGDLFQLLDRDGLGMSKYPVTPDADLQKYLKEALKDASRGDIPPKVKDGESLVLPNNLCIWATMNTSDQSLFPIDSAFKRRWEWRYMKIKNHPELGYRIKIGGREQDWWEFLKKINAIIATMTSSADKQLGYFFCTAQDGIISEQTFVSKVIFYLWNDVFKDYGFEDASLFRYKGADDEEHDLTFPDFYDEDGVQVDTERLDGFMQRVMDWRKGNEAED